MVAYLDILASDVYSDSDHAVGVCIVVAFHPNMLHYVLVTNKSGNVLLEKFFDVPLEERSQWRSFLVKLGADNLPNARDDEHFVAMFRHVFVVYCLVQDIHFFVAGAGEYDELGLSKVLQVVVGTLRDICKKGLREASLLDRYGKACLALDEIMAQGILEHMDKDRIRRLARLKALNTD